MKLTPNMEWPPVEYRPALDAVAHDRAWLTGNISHIKTMVAQHHPQARPLEHRAQYNGGIVGATARGLLGRPSPQAGSAAVDRHLPIASELTETIGDLLFGNAVGADTTMWPEKVGANLQAFISDDEFTASLVEAGQKCSALGWEFGRVVWNTEVSPHPWIDWVDADRAFATFEWGRLASVTFVDEYKRDRDVYRLTQEHRPGVVEYQLWRGTKDKLGTVVPYGELPETAYLADIVHDGTILETGTQFLTACMVPNRAKNPAWDGHEHLRFYGKSDIQFAGGLWEDIDKGYTDLWYEVDSARARLLIPEDYLTTLEPGQGSVFDWFRDVYPLGMVGTGDMIPNIERVQFDMRVKDYLTTIETTIERAVSAVGLSPLTVGMDAGMGESVTATEITARTTKTMNTWRARSRYWRAGLQQLLTAWGHIDAVLNGLQPPTELLKVSMVEPVRDTDRDRAETVKAWRDAESVSTWHAVQTLHPEWADDEVRKEVERIFFERGMSEPVDPFAVGADTYPDPSVPATPTGDVLDTLHDPNPGLVVSQQEAKQQADKTTAKSLRDMNTPTEE